MFLFKIIAFSFLVSQETRNAFPAPSKPKRMQFHDTARCCCPKKANHSKEKKKKIEKGARNYPSSELPKKDGRSGGFIFLKSPSSSVAFLRCNKVLVTALLFFFSLNLFGDPRDARITFEGGRGWQFGFFPFFLFGVDKVDFFFY